MAPRPNEARRHAGALMMAQGRPAGNAKEKLAKNPPATASVESSPRAVQPAKAGMLLPGHRLRRVLLSLQVIHDSFINCLDVTTPRGQSTFQTWAARTPPGVALVTPVHDNEGLRVGDCTLQSIAAMGYKTGRCGGADLVMMHPCEDSGSCKYNLQASKVIHLIKEKVMEPR